jgi:hypothetical protein
VNLKPSLDSVLARTSPAYSTVFSNGCALISSNFTARTGSGADSFFEHPDKMNTQAKRPSKGRKNFNKHMIKPQLLTNGLAI